ncbi:protein xhlA [Bacillus glycinifermentans]|uniref:11.0 kDa protein in cwlL 5'region n=1 Tax=Bacillus sonorensis TaxID=119858 RepID=A0ABM6LDM5_9BACI|nr:MULTISPECIES: hemolysin XhlA family protein [Bacillus]ASB87369.1 putative 11.0 kDa protein in cwlL 5'region [Bacillus sonorensis]KMM52324.1 protein xhlA [Bacillus glycinifermentans]MBU8786529.1 hemolysin XhlA family protein [Bacillus glycinifermentans]MDI3409699.1 hemolysin XhlA family protein [Bacillus sonorensis]MDR4958154.1 hemolysin XhlA family protein [Bacillus sonorensis]
MPQANEYDVLKNEITEVKADQKTLEQRVSTLERTSDRHDQQIISINEKLNKIEENTTWIKRSITGAIITAVCTLVISGIAALFINFIQK